MNPVRAGSSILQGWKMEGDGMRLPLKLPNSAATRRRLARSSRNTHALQRNATVRLRDASHRRPVDWHLVTHSQKPVRLSIDISLHGLRNRLACRLTSVIWHMAPSGHYNGYVHIRFERVIVFWIPQAEAESSPVFPRVPFDVENGRQTGVCSLVPLFGGS
jgi:hypothetical protein